MQTHFFVVFCSPISQDPFNKSAGSGGPCDGSFQNLQTGATERRVKGGNIEEKSLVVSGQRLFGAI